MKSCTAFTAALLRTATRARPSPVPSSPITSAPSPQSLRIHRPHHTTLQRRLQRPSPLSRCQSVLRQQRCESTNPDPPSEDPMAALLSQSQAESKPLRRSKLDSAESQYQPRAPPPPEPQPQPQAPPPDIDPSVPAYSLHFTCTPCTTRSAHRVSKQGYHFGTVLVQCPGCKARHLIADHLRIFSDKSVTIEDILRDKGAAVKRGTIDTEGDVEIYPEDWEVDGQVAEDGRVIA